MGSAKWHAIMISLPHQGHINPFVHLALKLASKGFTVTFVHLESVHYKLGREADPFSEARRSGLDIRYATIGDGLPLEFDRDLHFEEHWRVMMRDFPARVDEFVGKAMRSDPDWEYLLVTDTFYPWPAVVAPKYNLVNVSFWTQTALTFALPYHWHLLQLNGHFPCKDKMEEEIDYIPGVESINTKDVMSYLKESGVSSIVTKAMAAAFDAVKSADFILHNTMHELEPQTLSALHKYQPNYAVGPLNFSKNLHHSAVSNSLWSEADCTDWLRSKPPASVLYVSFGSFIHTTKQVMEELAHGLLLSGVDFVWVIRPGILSSGDADALPEGFGDEIKGKGLVVPWCNQIRVLSNPAVGGFLTHCGWNSTLESMWCGVPMICYPIAYDQTANRKLVIEKWKFGVNLCDGERLDRAEIAEKIKGFMSGASLEKLRQEATKLKAAMEKALEFDGSSERNFDRFVEDLKAKIVDVKSRVAREIR
ncbi:UDP-glycosyltransferase 86A1-like [Salvia miltiorrhiza]|uniref:UDP-glycosyltransferase 86A1-like n=1 Tax=Salvia miltiorrhiza TaxID=226208 RepID=UPI0025AD7081|nr:UDP-glycosyltransferase 86A1-like [Salvia miltiorrhiza]